MYYIIESCGDRRQMWGPYPTVEGARKAAGARHTVVTGDGLSDGRTMSRGELQVAVQTGRVRVADGSDSRALAGC